MLNHEVIILDQTFLDGASDVETLDATLVVTLNSAARVFLGATNVARDVETVNFEFGFDLTCVIVDEPDFGCPIDAADVSPTMSSSLFTRVLDDYTLKIVAKVAANVSWMCLWKLLKILASITVPVTIRETIRVDKLTLVAPLMHTGVAPLAYDNLISNEFF